MLNVEVVEVVVVEVVEVVVEVVVVDGDGDSQKMSGACNAAGGRNDAFGARKSPRGPATLGPSGTRTLGATETRHSIQCRPTGTPPY